MLPQSRCSGLYYAYEPYLVPWCGIDHIYHIISLLRIGGMFLLSLQLLRCYFHCHRVGGGGGGDGAGGADGGCSGAPG